MQRGRSEYLARRGDRHGTNVQPGLSLRSSVRLIRRRVVRYCPPKRSLDWKLLKIGWRRRRGFESWKSRQDLQVADLTLLRMPSLPRMPFWHCPVLAAGNTEANWPMSGSGHVSADLDF